ncbi:hypothetical protein [Streptomyces sp. WM6378]|nr:hypothetical protein [Streptomyces sp. WM6378]
MDQQGVEAPCWRVMLSFDIQPAVLEPAMRTYVHLLPWALVT